MQVLAYFYYNNRIYAGFSIPQMFALKVKYKDEDFVAAMRRTAHLYINVGGRIQLTQPLGKPQYLVPSIWFKYAPSSPINIHFGFRYHWNKTLALGLSYSTNGTFLGNFHLNIKDRVCGWLFCWCWDKRGGSQSGNHARGNAWFYYAGIQGRKLDISSITL